MIRPATLADIPRLRGLFADMLAEVRKNFPETPIYPAVDDDALDQFTLCLVDIVTRGQALWQVLVAENEGGLYGFVATEECRHPIGTPERFAHIHWLYVRPGARGARTATALAVAVMQWCAARGLEHLECEGSWGDSQHAHRGWKPFRVRYQTPVAQLADYIHTRVATPAEPPVITAERAAKVRKHVNGTSRRRRRPVSEQPEA